MLQKSKELFEVWNCNSLIYSHWKGNDHLMEGLDGDTDLDVLISPSDHDKGYSLLQEIGFKHFQSQYGSRYPNVEDWLGFDSETGKMLHLHLHYALMTGHTGLKEYELPWGREALETRIQDEESGVYIMNPNLELVSLYTRLILKSKWKWVRAARKGSYQLEKHFEKEITYIKQRVDWDVVSEIAIRYYGNSGLEFSEIVSSPVLTSEKYLRLYSIVLKSMNKYCRFHGVSHIVRRAFMGVIVPLRSIVRKKYNWQLITHKVANPSHGLMIAFIGQDGSGKSTVTADIKKWLTWKIEAQRFYLGSGEHFNPIEKRVGNKLAKMEGRIWRPIRNVLSFRLIKKIADNAYTNIRRASKYVHKGGVALFDRFPQTEFANINDGPKIRSSVMPKVSSKIGKWLVGIYASKEEAKLKKAVAYQPDIVFKLTLSPEESIRRKPQENYESVKRKHEIIKQLAFPGSSVYNVDATMEYEQELRIIKRIIWKHIQEL